MDLAGRVHAQVNNPGRRGHELETKADSVKQMSHVVCELLDCVELHVGEIRY